MGTMDHVWVALTVLAASQLAAVLLQIRGFLILVGQLSKTNGRINDLELQAKEKTP